MFQRESICLTLPACNRPLYPSRYKLLLKWPIMESIQWDSSTPADKWQATCNNLFTFPNRTFLRCTKSIHSTAADSP